MSPQHPRGEEGISEILRQLTIRDIGGRTASERMVRMKNYLRYLGMTNISNLLIVKIF